MCVFYLIQLTKGQGPNNDFNNDLNAYPFGSSHVSLTSDLRHSLGSHEDTDDYDYDEYDDEDDDNDDDDDGVMMM